MPSASKRRRAAAKKKKAQDNAMINSPPLGNGELKSEDIQNGDSPTHHENARQPASDAESIKQESSNVNNDQVKGGNEEEDCAIVIESDSQSNESSEAENVSLEEPKTNEYDNEEHSDDSKNPACSENQPLVASIQMIQKTSWWSCCGLFEVLRASDR